ncbi:MAG: hypothetical protein V3T77_11205 [Planctomycetota bacterium]
MNSRVFSAVAALILLASSFLLVMTGPTLWSWLRPPAEVPAQQWITVQRGLHGNLKVVANGGVRVGSRFSPSRVTLRADELILKSINKWQVLPVAGQGKNQDIIWASSISVELKN